MKKVYKFRKIVEYEVEANSLDEAIDLRNDFDGEIYDCANRIILDRESIKTSSWKFENSVSSEEIEKVVLDICSKYGAIEDEDGDRYTITDKGRAYLDALNGDGDFDEDDFDENGDYIDDEEDIEDEFYDYLTDEE